LLGFQKKTQKTPKKKLDLAQERMNAFLAEEKSKQETSPRDQKSKNGKKR
jgi:phage-related protein